MYKSLFAFLGNVGAKKLFEMYFSIEISEQFIACMDSQLTTIFEKTTGINVKPPIRLGWLDYNEKSNFVFNKGSVSKLNAKILLQHGILEVWILWKSKSGRIYEIADTDINCDDIEFWFEGLDAELCRNYLNPKWTLFTLGINKTFIINQFKKHAVDTSYEFLNCADEQLTVLITKLTGIKPNKNLSIVIPTYYEDPAIKTNLPILETGEVSKLNITLYINHNWNANKILWKSKSGKIYKTSDADIDCTDIEFWFEQFDAALYIEQFYPKGQKLPFVLKDLPYELIVTRLNIDCNLLLSIKNGYQNTSEDIIKGLHDFTKKFNEASEKKSDEGEIVEKYLAKQDGASTIVFEIDMSLAGFEYLKKLLKYLTKVEGIEKVEIS